MLKVKAFSCFLARVYVPTLRVFTYANKEGTAILPVQRTYPHICIQCPRSPLLPRRSCRSLALCVPSVTSLITPGKQQAGEPTRAPPGNVDASPRCPAPANVTSCRGLAGAQQDAPRFRARWAVRFIWRLNYLLSHYRLVLNKEDATSWGVFVGFLSLSFPVCLLKEKKQLPVTNWWGCELGQGSSSLYSDYISFLTERALSFFFFFFRAKATSYAKSQGVSFTCSRLKCVKRNALVTSHGNSCN